MAQLNVAWKTSANVTEFANIAPDTTSDEGIAAQAIKDIYTAAFAKMVYAKSDEEALTIMNKAKDDMIKAGHDKLLKFQTKIWQENKKKLGMK
jgi:putative aldouronate transport system substrate-binding protein